MHYLYIENYYNLFDLLLHLWHMDFVAAVGQEFVVPAFMLEFVDILIVLVVVSPFVSLALYASVWIQMLEATGDCFAANYMR